MIPSKVCPLCLRIAVGTVVFDQWEIFCPDCKIGAGMFNNWPVAPQYELDKQDERSAYYKEKLNNGDYQNVPNMNSRIRAGIESEIEPTPKT